MKVTEKIEGYENLSPEDKLKAIEALELDAPVPATNEDIEKLRADNEKLRKTVSAVNSEAADYKRQLREKQTTDEREKAEREEREKATLAELEGYRRTAKIADAKSHYLALGYDDVLATETATAEVDGNTELRYANELKFNKIQRETIEASLLQKQPQPTVGSNPGGQPDLMDLSDEDYYKAVYHK